MDNSIAQFLKELFPNKWETVLFEIEDIKHIQQRLISMMHQCMPYDDYVLFSLSVRAVNEIIDEESAEVRFEEYLNSHEAKETLRDFDIASDSLPLSIFRIDFQKFQSLVLERYYWLFSHSTVRSLGIPEFIPKESNDCDAYIYNIAFLIHLRWDFIKSSIICKYRESIISQADAILTRKWENISVADYDRAVEMLRSVEAYSELINILREWVYIRGENGWKVKRSDTIEAMRLEEMATRESYNVTLQDWANMYEYDDKSSYNLDNTKAGILETFYNQGSGLAALILGDLNLEKGLWPIRIKGEQEAYSKEMVESMSEYLKVSLAFYKEAAARGYAIGYLTQSLIYKILGEVEIAVKFELEYKKSPYSEKRVSYNLLRDYKETFQYEERTYLINNNFKDENGDPCKDWLTPLPLSLLALDENEATKYLHTIFDEVLPMLNIN